jgi:hypothetical protein
MCYALVDNKRNDGLFISRNLKIQVFHDVILVLLDEHFPTFHRVIMPSGAGSSSSRGHFFLHCLTLKMKLL